MKVRQRAISRNPLDFRPRDFGRDETLGRVQIMRNAMQANADRNDARFEL